jgi:Ca-activated chloride channel homolog
VINSLELSLRTDRSLVRATARSTRFLQIGLVAPAAPAREGRLPINVGLVLDRSGSMEGARKFMLARDAVEQSLRLLRPEDRFTLVVYDTEVDVLMPSSLATPAAKRTALQRLADIAPRGSTDLYDGWMTGATQLLEHLNANGVSRVLLLTDGLANAGITESTALTAAAADLRRRGIATSTFGVGSDFDEVLMRDIAREGGGQCYYIEGPAQIADLLTSELGEALEIVRRGAVLQVALPPGAQCELLNPYRTTHAPGENELRIELGDLTAQQELSLVVRLTFPEDRAGATTSARVGLVGPDALAQEMEAEITWTYADHAANDRQPRDVTVDREVATLYAGRARAEATEANRRGDYRAAQRVLEATVRRIRQYAGHDPELNAIWRALLAEVERFGNEMSLMERKSSFFAAQMCMSSRAPDGKARRRQQ